MYQSTSTCIAWVCHSPLHSRPLLPLGEEEYISKAHKSRLPMSFSAFTCSFDSSFFPLHRSFYYNLKSSSAIIYLHSCRQCLLGVAFKAALIHRCSLNTYESDPNLRGIHWDLPESLVHSAKGKQHGQKEEMPNMMIYLSLTSGPSYWSLFSHLMWKLSGVFCEHHDSIHFSLKHARLTCKEGTWAGD